MSIRVNPTTLFLLAVILGVLTVVLSCPAAEAWWFWGNKDKSKPEKVDPPPVSMLQTQCEPYRQKVVQMNEKNIIIRGLYRPRKAYLKSKYYQCIRSFNKQERRFLESVALPSSHNTTTSQENSFNPALKQ